MKFLRARGGLSVIQGVWGAALLGMALLAGCGGNDSESSSTDTTATTAAAGTVTGVSANWVQVNGIKYDKSSAQVVDEDGVAISGSALKLGMQAEVQASSMNRARGSGRASRIAFGSALVGTVDDVIAGSNQIIVLGQTVQISDGTVFDDDLPDGIGSVTAGSIVSVHGLLDATSGITSATRVDLKSAASTFRLRGVVSSLQLDAKTMLVGGQPINFASASKVPADLADGQVVRVSMAAEQVDGQFVAKTVRADKNFVADGAAVDLDAIVTQFTSQTSFKIFGLLVDATNATITNADSLKRGARVNVKGALVDGVLVASSVDVKVRGGNAAELQGTVEAFDADARTFTLNGVTVVISNKTAFSGGAEADLADGVSVNVKGKLTANGTKLKAQTIEIVAADGVAQVDLQGTVSGLVADDKTFLIGDVTVDFSAAVVDETVATLADGVAVTATGVLSDDGTKLTASSVVVNTAAAASRRRR